MPAPGPPAPQQARARLFSTIGQDAPAGLVVFLVALPLCLGISLASGAPLLAGVISGIVGGVLVSLLSGSAVSVSGPAAGLTVVMLSAIASLGSWPAVLAATVVAGVIQMVLGLFRAGIIALYFPAAVIRGMLAAIGIILILKQTAALFGGRCRLLRGHGIFAVQWAEHVLSHWRGPAGAEPRLGAGGGGVAGYPAAVEHGPGAAAALGAAGAGRAGGGAGRRGPQPAPQSRGPRACRCAPSTS